MSDQKSYIQWSDLREEFRQWHDSKFKTNLKKEQMMLRNISINILEDIRIHISTKFQLKVISVGNSLTISILRQIRDLPLCPSFGAPVSHGIFKKNISMIYDSALVALVALV